MVRTRNNDQLVFSVKPRLLTLLGDQLIRDANLAVFELVKNAYDADATKCLVVLEQPDDPSAARITIRDNGCGMDEDILRNVWMVIATDHRAEQRKHNQRTEKFHRFPLGEKGLGRLSIHKLGRHIRLITRKKGGDELVMEFDWDKLENAESLDAASITLQRRTPITFPGKKHGTKLIVTSLRESWKRGELRRLHSAVNSLCSPYEGPTDFKIRFSAPGREDWLKGLFKANAVYGYALYHVRGCFEGDSAQFNYEFIPPTGAKDRLTSRTTPFTHKLERKEGRKSYPLDLSSHAIGRVDFDFWLYDLDKDVLKVFDDEVIGLKDYMNENGGIRIYRDGIRVYDFGEPGNDWLNLDLRRVNTPTARTSNNQILGCLVLDATKSDALREKSNREGFIQNEAYEDFKSAVISVLTNIETEKSKDQKRVRAIVGKGTGQKIFSKITELKEKLETKGVYQEVKKQFDALEKELEIYQGQLLHAAVPGLSIGIMLHGAEKILDELREAVKKDAETAKVKGLVDRLYRAMRPVTNLLKNPNVVKTSAHVLLKEAIFSTELRLKRHDITLVCNLDDAGDDFKLEGSKQMLIASITNLVDNAIHWLEMKNPSPKLLYLGTTRDIEGGPAIVVADNGPGFGNDDPDDLVEPFVTRRNGGMGLGLYIVREVMRVTKGRLVFPEDGDVALPQKIDGAVVALQFQEAQ